MNYPQPPFDPDLLLQPGPALAFRLSILFNEDPSPRCVTLGGFPSNNGEYSAYLLYSEEGSSRKVQTGELPRLIREYWVQLVESLRACGGGAVYSWPQDAPRIFPDGRLSIYLAREIGSVPFQHMLFWKPPPDLNNAPTLTAPAHAQPGASVSPDDHVLRRADPEVRHGNFHQTQ